MKSTHILYFSISIPFTTLCLLPNTVFAQREPPSEAQLTLSEIFAIGADESQPLEYLFSNPQAIRTDNEGHIYVADRNERGVRVFSRNGEYLGTLGRRGRGPGEFVEVSGIAIDTDDRLIAYDRALKRFTRFQPFSPDMSLPLPEEIETFPNPVPQIVTPMLMRTLPNGHLLLFYHPTFDCEAHPERFHIFDENFQKIDAFGTPDEWELASDVYSQLLATGWTFYSAAITGKGAVVPPLHLYDGSLLHYRPSAGEA